MAELVNANPTIYKSSNSDRRAPELTRLEEDDDISDEIDKFEVFELLRGIKDPEHPNSLEQLRVIEASHIQVNDKKNYIRVQFTPTVPHCSMTALIGLCIRVKLARCVAHRFKIDVYVTPGSHDQEVGVNKQLNDKERVAAALENERMLHVVGSCLKDFQ